MIASNSPPSSHRKVVPGVQGTGATPASIRRSVPERRAGHVVATTVFAARSPSRCLRLVAAIITSPITKKSTSRSRLRMLAWP